MELHCKVELRGILNYVDSFFLQSFHGGGLENWLGFCVKFSQESM